jgi:hypothetical protein
MLARSTDDMEKYPQDRYKFAKLISSVWFDKLSTMSEELVKEIKRKLDGKTLVGEYIGSQENQHLVKYSRVSIIFYAIVDNYSEESCWPCSKSWAFFKKFDLDVVHIQSLGVFDDYDKLCD